MYYCELINEGVIVDSVYRKGDSEKSVLWEINMWDWPQGRWTITETEGENT